MLNQNFAGMTANIHRANRPDIVPAKEVDFIDAMRKAGQDYEKAQQKAKLDALAVALKNKDQDQIDSAFADVDPYGRAGWLYDRNAKVEDRDAGFQHNMNMLDKQFQNSIALSDHNLGNSKSLAQFNASLKQQAAEYEKNAAQEELNKRLGIIEQMHDAGTISDMQYIGARSKLLNLGLELPKQTSIKDFAAATKDLASANVDVDALNQYAADNGFGGLKFNPAEKKYANGDVGLVQMMVDEGVPLMDAMSRVGKMSADEKLDYETKKAQNTGAIKFGYDSALANLNAENALNNSVTLEAIKNENAERGKLQQFNLDLQKMLAQSELDKDFETFKSELPTETIRNAQQMSALSGEPVQNLLLQEYNQHQIEWRQKLADIDYKQAQTAKIQRENSQPYISPIDEYRQKAEIDAEVKQRNEDRKSQLEKEESAKQNAIMRPRVMKAISRAEDALKDGTGLGQFGGWGWTSENGGKNRAAIQSAQAQINTVMRGMLKEMGVGSTELNSAAEAAAYRYTISPNMPISQIEQIIENFKQDYLDGTLQNEVAAVASQYGGGSSLPVGTIEDGYRFKGGNPADKRNWEKVK